KYYVKKFEAETNITGYLVMDLSQSMGFTFRQELTKFDYAICLAAALCYLMVLQQDPVGLITFDTRIRQSLSPRSKRTQLGIILSQLSQLQPTGQTDIANSLTQIAAMLRHMSLVMIFSDLLGDTTKTLQALRRLRHGGHDVILFHILDEAEVSFPFHGVMEFEDPENDEKLQVDAGGIRDEYLAEVNEFRETIRRECVQIGVDYMPLDTSTRYDSALMEYLLNRRGRY
ncbi:MAG: VWA domain-containing protein, partial [Planctomycetales bacterium]|nr:VWA domain-containing protein [Planctomycetales bacterium]